MERKIDGELKKNKEVVLYFDNIDGHDLHQFLSGLGNDQKKIIVNLPMFGHKASIVIHPEADQKHVEEVIDTLAETEFINKGGVGYCYIQAFGKKHQHILPNQSAGSSGKGPSMEITVKGGNKTDARLLNNILNSKNLR